MTTEQRGAYIHLLKVVVKKNQVVKAGEKIGESNDTGKSLGPHLHYTQYTDTTKTETVDPTEVHSDC
jgi:murein DD-endopeptidase MepM/ murein hydrolase activator NlpD